MEEGHEPSPLKCRVYFGLSRVRDDRKWAATTPTPIINDNTKITKGNHHLPEPADLEVNDPRDAVAVKAMATAGNHHTPVEGFSVTSRTICRRPRPHHQGSATGRTPAGVTSAGAGALLADMIFSDTGRNLVIGLVLVAVVAAALGLLLLPVGATRANGRGASALVLGVAAAIAIAIR